MNTKFRTIRSVSKTKSVRSKSKSRRSKSKSRRSKSKSRRSRHIYGGGEGDCPICLEPLDKDTTNPLEKIYTTDCGHEFHEHCLVDNCKKSRRECPLCKSNIGPDCDYIIEGKAKTKVITLKPDEIEKAIKDAIGDYDKKINAEKMSEIRRRVKNLVYNPTYVNCFGEGEDEDELAGGDLYQQVVYKIQCYLNYDDPITN